MDYNSIYKNKNLFGTEPHWLVRKILKYKKSGTVLDIGAGQGRNSLFLAKNGFEVTAIDTAAEGIKKIQESVARDGLSVETEIADINGFKFEKQYDVIVVLFALQHLIKDDVPVLLEKINGHTALYGLNVVAAFTTEGDFYKLQRNRKYFYPAPGQLKETYKDWNVLEWEEKQSTAFQKDKEGRQLKNLTSFLISQKR